MDERMRFVIRYKDGESMASLCREAPNILVNAVAPGFTLTSSFDGVSEESKTNYIDGTLIKRWIAVEEVAHAFLYLASADGITGEVLVIDGGWNLK